MKLNLGDNIRTYRRAMDMTQEQLAEQLGVSFQSVSRWENGTTYPDMELLPALARIFSVTVDALLGVSDEERRIQFEAVCETLKKELYAEKKNEESITAVLRELRRDYMEFFFNDTYYFTDLRQSGAYRLPAVMQEVRLIFDEIIRKCDSNFVKSFFIEQMAEMEDEEHIVPFLRQNATAADLSGNELLRRRYLFRGEYDKLDKLRQAHLYELLDELCGNGTVWYIRDKNDYSAEYCRYVNDACLGVLHSVCGLTPDPKNPVTGNGSLDVFADIRLNLGAKRAAAYAGTGDIEEALVTLEDWISLFEKVMAAADGTGVRCTSPAMDAFAPEVTSFWIPIAWKNCEERFALLQESGEHTYLSLCEPGHFYGDQYGLFDPSGYLCYFAPDFKGAFLNPRWFDSIRENPRFQAVLDRLHNLIETRELTGT
ncbi:MAG: helix-turn-helix transcriptional regulator [Clostridia bacterium]|nr:helix-turn-helix transcriptional regulator [Clostridia bacterium]MBQ9996032.1 helix-turn-helix transcriptional regulator [Clostridia bacterium]